jgi:hypothetical protein
MAREARKNQRGRFPLQRQNRLSTTKKPGNLQETGAKIAPIFQGLRNMGYNNRRRVRRAKSKGLQRLRSELCERTFAHICDSGGMRRTWLRELVNVSKRYVLAAAAHNLGRMLRKLFGIGKPRVLQGEGGLAALVQLAMMWAVIRCWRLETPAGR